jgi:hypothetical protein
MKLFPYLLCLFSFIANGQTQKKPYYFNTNVHMMVNDQHYNMNGIGVEAGINLKYKWRAGFGYSRYSGSTELSHLLTEDQKKHVTDIDKKLNPVTLHNYFLSLTKSVNLSEKVALFVKLQGIYFNDASSEHSNFKFFPDKRINYSETKLRVSTTNGFSVGWNTGFSIDIRDDLHLLISGSYYSRRSLFGGSIGFAKTFNLKK